ncbi:alpha-2-macroglobulin [Novosphingobium sp. FKTRR1]|uniref:alpha-2-macroglobulin family protein n=1 Tax=Novosphingobium sp. FKTRR1 TaxID=2879118 RepID=UPI001CF0951A|nr:MG2 domain-containing protein [Novosphingobium sp. FKTRR1]
MARKFGHGRSVGGGWRMLLPLLALAPLTARGDLPAQVTLATPGSTGSGSGAIDRFTIRFSQAMVALGDPRAKAPVTNDCKVASTGNWVDPQTYVLDFERTLPAGTSCKVTLTDGVATASGTRLIGQRSFTIDTAGPSLRAVLAPGEEGSEIDEDQVFLVATNDRADPASVAAHAACAIDGVGETTAVDVLPADTALKVLSALGKDDWRRNDFLSQAEISPDVVSDPRRAQAALGNVLALKCRRPLPPEKDMALVWPSAITDLAGKAAGRDQRFDFTVRHAFEATFECSRSNGSAGCNPILPAHLRFSSAIDRNQALAIRLKLADGSERTPTLDDNEKNNAQVGQVSFAGPFPADSQAQVVLPQGIRDLSGRNLANAARFPLPVRFDPAPPLVKFAANFGIIEANEAHDLPVTVRAVEPQLAGKFTSVAGISAKIADNDAQIADWLRRLDKAGEDNIERIEKPDAPTVSINHTGEKPLLTGGQGSAIKLDLPGKGKTFEVVGVPLGGKGFHVVELASPALGNALLGRNVPRYVAAGALVTNMAVHFKWGREASLVWVTALDSAKPVAGAAVRISDSCDGRQLVTGRTGADGTLTIRAGLPKASLYTGCDEGADHTLMVSARAGDDMSFTLSNWNKGISPYDFDLSFGSDERNEIVHTVFDRTLVRVGETVHFKHILRKPVGPGFAFGQGFSGKLVFQHQGSDTRFEQDATIDGMGSGTGEWTVPTGAPLGDYALSFTVGDRTIDTGQTVKVDEYKLPTMRATITGPKDALVQPASVPLSLFVGYLSGGGAGHMPVTLRTDFSAWFPTPRGWDAFSFGGDPVQEGTRALGADEAETPTALPYAQTLPASLGADGTARADIAINQAITRPLSLTVEMDYPDANGETMTASRVLTLYPSALQVGLRSDGWLMRDDDLRLQMVVLDLHGKPVSGQDVTIDLYSRETITARRRLIGGFYAYDNQEKITKLSGGCTTRSDALGRASCQLAPGVSGEVTVVARVKDAEGREARAVKSVWLAGKDDWWFGGDNGDRMDVIPEATEYKAGDVAKFQVRMPFREATALVTVEREGVLSSFVTTLSGTDPVVEVKLPGDYAPNVYVSVMAVRGRVGGWALWFADLARRWHLPFFRQDAASPTAMVDLAKPSYRIGMAKVAVGAEAHRLAVSLKPQRERYAVRETAQVALAVHRPDGSPASGADVAFVAVDEALLQLSPNKSWDLIGAMMGERSLEVATSTAQMQVVGKRHYGKKAVAAGGGGGDASAVNRENFQPVLLWQGHVALDAKGEALVAVPLSDALSRFRLVAVATEGAQLFGTGEASVRTAQDLAAYPGLPSLVRTGDHFEAAFTLRNGSDHAMTVTAQASVEPLIARPGPLTLTIPAGGAGRVRWGVFAPDAAGPLKWTLKVKADDGRAQDSVTTTQDVAPAVPEEVWAASLLRVGDPAPMIAVPQGALPGGRVTVDLTDSLSAPLAGVRAYMADYPYTCFEQRLSRIVVTGDAAGWGVLAGALPTYLDGDGLVRYWPEAQAQGSAELTAYVLAMTSAAGLPLPEDGKTKITAALTRVVQGRLTRDRPLRVDERPVRIAALAALARAGAADPGLVARIDMVPADMPTATLADWIVALDRLPRAPNAAGLKAAAEGELRRRLVYSGTRLDLVDQANAPWWMMVGADEMAIKALDAVIGKPGWSGDVPRLMTGVAARQQRGHWDTTPANAWGVIASRRFAAAYPASAITGTTRVALGTRGLTVNWPRKGEAVPLSFPLAAGPLTLSQSGGAGPWATVTVRAAVPLRQPLMAGYRLSRSVTVVTARHPGRWSAGDVVRVHLQIDANADRSQVVLSDPLLPGATVLSSLGGQSAILQQGEQASGAAPSYRESTREAWRAYFDWLPRGTTVIEYTVRLNAPGTFSLPPARVEAMYAPAIRAQLPIGPVTVWGS